MFDIHIMFMYKYMMWFTINILQRQDILKAKFLSSDSGMSPANFFITHQFIDTVSPQPHQIVLLELMNDVLYGNV